MAYILLIAGIILIILGTLGIGRKRDKVPSIEPMVKEDKGMFENILLNREILQKLEIIEEKIDALGESEDKDSTITTETLIHEHKTQLNIMPEEVNDINRKIIRMRNDGMGIEEIAEELGLMKGEILLRLGIKK